MFRLTGIICLILFMAVSVCFNSACGKVKPLSLSSLVEEDKTWEQLVTEGQTARNSGKMDVAETSFKEAITICEEKFGVEDARTGTCVGYLAELYKSQQEYLKAEREYKRWLSIMDKHDSTGEQVKAIRRGYRQVKKKIKKYGLRKEDPKEDAEDKEDTSSQDSEEDSDTE